MGARRSADMGPSVTLPDGRVCQRREELHPRRYVSIFGEFHLSRVAYGSREGQKIDHFAAPWTIGCSWPWIMFSYLFSGLGKSELLCGGGVQSRGADNPADVGIARSTKNGSCPIFPPMLLPACVATLCCCWENTVNVPVSPPVFPGPAAWRAILSGWAAWLQSPAARAATGMKRCPSP